MKLLRRKKFVIPAIAGIAALVGAGVAFGYFTTHGSGTGSATAGTPSSLLMTAWRHANVQQHYRPVHLYLVPSVLCDRSWGAGEQDQIWLTEGGHSDVVVAMANFNPVSHRWTSPST